MARGWESKSVEEQQSAFREPAGERKARLDPAQAKQNREREGLELSRKRILAQLEAATHPNHRKMLEQTLSELDAQLAHLPRR
jgi:hypothetical protein